MQGSMMEDMEIASPASQTNSNFAVFSMVMSSMMLMPLLGYHFSVLNPLLPVVQDVFNETYFAQNGEFISSDAWLVQLTLTTSLLIAGGFVGGITIGVVRRWLGSSKNVLRFAHAVNVVALAVECGAGQVLGSFEAVAVGRFFSGIPLGIGFTMCPLMVLEICTKSRQPLWQSSLGFILTVGLFFGALLSNPKLLGTRATWTVPIALGGLTSLVYLVASFWLPNTPYFLVRQGKVDEAKHELSLLRQHCGKDDVLEEIAEIQKETKGSTTDIGLRELFKVPQYRKQTLAVSLVVSNMMLTGINNFVLYSDLVFLEAGVARDVASYATVAIFFLQMVSGGLGSKLTDRFGGYRVTIVGNSILFSLHLLFTLFQVFNHHAPNVMPYLSIVAVALFIATWAATINGGTWALMGDLTTARTRPAVLGLASPIVWFWGWFVGFIAPYLQNSLGAYALAIWLVWSLGFIFVLHFFIPDTKGKTSDEVQASFK